MIDGGHGVDAGCRGDAVENAAETGASTGNGGSRVAHKEQKSK